MNTELLSHTAAQMVAPGLGVLAADESTGTCTKRFEAVGIESTEESRRQYRHTLFAAPDLEKYVSGVILYDETFRQKADSGSAFPEFLKERGILAGIKVDTGAKPFAGFEGETITEGLDGLPARLEEYAALGAAFAKWRAVIAIDTEKQLPTNAALTANAHALARYARACQEAGVVPIVEPEVLMDGPHSIDDCKQATNRALHAVFEALQHMGVYLPGMVLKPNMVLPGNKSEKKDVEEVADVTTEVLVDCVPGEVGGIAFLSGGQTNEEATAHLAAICAKDTPWPVTFSFGRALQSDALTAFSKGDTQAAATALIGRCQANSKAAKNS